MSLNTVHRRILNVLKTVEDRSSTRKQKHKLILYDPETRQPVYETPDEQLAPLQPGEPRVVFRLPQKKSLEAGAQGYRG